MASKHIIVINFLFDLRTITVVKVKGEPMLLMKVWLSSGRDSDVRVPYDSLLTVH